MLHNSIIEAVRVYLVFIRWHTTDVAYIPYEYHILTRVVRYNRQMRVVNRHNSIKDFPRQEWDYNHYDNIIHGGLLVVVVVVGDLRNASEVTLLPLL